MFGDIFFQLFFAEFDFENDPNYPSVILKLQPQVLPNTLIYDIGIKDEYILQAIIRVSFWIIGVASIAIWFIMCIKDLIDERKEE